MYADQMQTLYLFRHSGSTSAASAARQIPRKPVCGRNNNGKSKEVISFSKAPSPGWHPCLRSGGRVIRNIYGDFAGFCGDIFVIVTRRIHIPMHFNACSMHFQDTRSDYMRFR